MALSFTTAQAANVLGPGNGTNVEAAGANCAVFVVESAPSGAGGIYTFEKSTDEGSNWGLLTVTDADTGAALAGSASAAARDGFTVIADEGLDGDVLLRARISTAWTVAAPKVIAVVQRGS